MKHLILTATLALATPALAQEAVLYEFDGDFDDATFSVESAILDKGLVIDYVSHTGDMLNRTGEDIGGAEIFAHADIFLFCSAVVSRDVMEADPLNIAHCPYNIYVIERDGVVQIGHRNYPEGAMQAVQSLLSEIVLDAGGVQ